MSERHHRIRRLWVTLSTAAAMLLFMFLFVGEVPVLTQQQPE